MRNKIIFTLIICSSLLFVNRCIEPTNPYAVIPPGTWRGILYLDSQTAIRPAQDLVRKGGKPDYAEKPEGELPFLFEIAYDTDTSFTMTIRNGEERIPVEPVAYRWDRTTSRWALRFDFPVYDSYIEAQFEEEAMQGYWTDRKRGNYRIPFVAWHGETERFPEDVETGAEMDVSGRWAVRFGEGEDAWPAIAELDQEGKDLTGTFLTQTGDYRYLAGMVEGRKLYLSTFDGTHAYLYHAKMMEEGKLEGFYKSGKHFVTSWTARRDTSFQLADPHSMTGLSVESDRVEIAFPDTKGRMVSTHDPAYSGKVRVVQIMGTWCPNCLDETDFLIEYLSENPELDLQVIAISFEKYRDPEKAKASIDRFANEKEVPYPVLYGGDTGEAQPRLDFLDRLRSYPTMIIMDKTGKVRRIHTGFFGPATSEYATFAAEFDTLIRQLVKE